MRKPGSLGSWESGDWLSQRRIQARLRGNLVGLKDPIHGIALGNGVEALAITGGTVGEELLDVVENGDAVAVVAVAEEAAVASGGVDGFNAGEDHHVFAGVARSRVAAVELAGSVEGEVLRRGVECDAMSLGDDVGCNLPFENVGVDIRGGKDNLVEEGARKGGGDWRSA